MTKFRQQNTTNTHTLTSIQSFFISLGLHIWATQILIPFYPVPLTLHTFVWGFNTLFLGETWKPLVVYTLLRFAFPSMSSINLIYSIGYLAGMLIAGIITSKIFNMFTAQSTSQSINHKMALLLYPCGMFITYTIGAGYLALVHGFGFWQCITPYILAEIIKYSSLLILTKLHSYNKYN